MAADKKFLVRSIQKKKDFIVAYCGFTNMPLAVCDPDSFNDQVWIFDTEDQLKEFAVPYQQKKIQIRGVKFPNRNFLGFFGMLFSTGINELVFVNSGGKQTLALEDLVKRPDYSHLPREQQPVTNPQLQLTGMYFMQEASRKVPNEEKTDLPELEEELFVNMMKARYLMPIEMADGPGTEAEKLRKKQYRLPVMKNQNDEILQPLFTDPNELAKFDREKKFRALAVPYDNLPKLMIKDSKGFLLNPAGYHIAMPRELLDELNSRYDLKGEEAAEEEKEDKEEKDPAG